MQARNKYRLADVMRIAMMVELMAVGIRPAQAVPIVNQSRSAFDLMALEIDAHVAQPQHPPAWPALVLLVSKDDDQTIHRWLSSIGQLAQVIIDAELPGAAIFINFGDFARRMAEAVRAGGLSVGRR